MDRLKEYLCRSEVITGGILCFLAVGLDRWLPQVFGIKSEVLIGLSVFFTIFAIIKVHRDRFPPGPVGLPIVGYFPYLSKKLYLDLTKIGQKYGDVFSISLGSKTVVILHGAEVIREALTKPEFLGRPPDSPLSLLSPKSPFFDSDIRRWKEQRRFVVQSMKDLGLGKTKIEDDVQDEIRHFLAVLERFCGEPLNLYEPITPSMSNNICALVFGKRYDYDDPDRKLLDKGLHDANTATTQTSSFMFFPWLKFVPFYMKFLKVKTAVKAIDEMKNFFLKEISKRSDKTDSKDVKDFIDSYILEMKSRKERDPNTTFSDETLVSTAMDLFGAGSETVRTSILWCVYTMAAYPDVQKRVQAEIDHVIGMGRSPEFMDQKSMPYTQAVILEIMRWQPVVPLNIMHYTTADSTAGGYNIPQGTIVIANFWNVHHDTRYWEDPSAFKPERFLSSDGKSVVKSNNFMAFSLGRRVCPGETMAMMEVFLYFTSMLQKFDIVFPDGFKPTFESDFAVTYSLKPYPVRFIERH